MSTSEAAPAVRTAGLIKNFGSNRAVDGIDLEVRPGEIFGVLGPNGAGKTTMLAMLATLLSIDAGQAEIFGYPSVPYRGGVHPAACKSSSSGNDVGENRIRTTEEIQA